MTDLQASQAYVLAATQFPSEEVQASQAYVLASTLYANTIKVQQAYVLAAVRSRTSDPAIRAWTYTMDGHDFYVLRLGNTETLVFDALTEQWQVFGSESTPLWRAYCGQNWVDGARWADDYGSNVVAGDDGAGTLYFLDPDNSYDDHPVSGSDNPRTFERQLTGQVVKTGYDVTSCFAVEMLGSLGDQFESALTTVTLETSDDSGHTYDSHGSITVPNDDYTVRAQWLSLGSFGTPGRLFRITDTGALFRIDSLDMTNGNPDGK